ncbi:hypothetical protein [Streptomyces sp. NBC_00576]|uniref:hypothetical protein n=1 Tax=Streptomyces sp. NBC_00576 TaxID=2903665 RepID=UPI002E801F6F|nr:hypothetical protein [Streptomyces sp. NBC_00576]WUB72541.1 hypothetical protein OG734_21830 [Streptomyces sp. NBC_00576]
MRNRPGLVALPGPHPVPLAPAPEPRGEDVLQELVLKDLTREQVSNWRTRAAPDHLAVFNHIERYGEVSARHLFTGHLVILVQGLPGLASRFTKRAVRPVTKNRLTPAAFV